MRGTISAIAPDGTYGQIATLDGQRMSYWTSEVRNGAAQVGQAVEFRIEDNQPVDIMILPAARPAPPPMGGAAPSRIAPAQRGMPMGGGAMAATVSMPDIPTDKNYWVALLTSPNGRISRKQFWLHGVVPIVIASVLLGWIPIVGQLISLALLWSSICIAFKRFHDVGYPGWWSLVYIVPMIAGTIVFVLSFYYLDSDWPARLGEILWILGGLVMLAQLIFVYIRAGEQGPNRYGPDPLEAVF